MFIFYYIVLLTMPAALCFLYSLLFRGSEKRGTLFFKTVSVALFLAFFIRILSGISHLEAAYSMYLPEIESTSLTVLVVLLDWFNVAAVLTAVFSPFFATKHRYRMLTYFALPVCIANIIILRYGIIGISGSEEFSLRTVVYAAEQGLLLAVCLFNLFSAPAKSLRISLKNLLGLAAVIAGTLICTLPAYTLKALFGPGNGVSVSDFTQVHRILLYIGFGAPIIIYLLLKNKDMAVKKYACLLITVGTFFTFTRSFIFVDFLNPTSWPLHLCNTAMYILPLCLVFKLKRLYYFSLFINVLGALLAMLMPNYGDTSAMFSIGMQVFWVNHLPAFFMPIVILALGIFERPKLKQFRYSIAGFAMYFLFALFINAWFTNYKPDVDYFFINSGYVASQLGKWAENLRLITFTFNIKDLKFVIYPVYQAIFFGVYVLLSLVVWFIFEGGRDLTATWGKLIKENTRLRAGERAASDKRRRGYLTK